MYFSVQEKNKLKRYIHVDAPLGPVDAAKIKDSYVSGKLFDSHNELYKHINKRPSLIIGRKGSGKSAFLKNINGQKKYKIKIEVKTHRAFSEIVKTVQATTKSCDDFIYTEEVADLWDFLLVLPQLEMENCPC